MLINFFVHFLGCSGSPEQFNSSKGYIASPNHPGTYYDDLFCEWIITAAKGTNLTLTFNDFDIQSDSDGRCSSDYVKINDGNDANAPLLGIYCGGIKPKVLTTQGGSIYVNFVTDGKSGGKGFFALFTTFPSSTEKAGNSIDL